MNRLADATAAVLDQTDGPSSRTALMVVAVAVLAVSSPASAQSPQPAAGQPETVRRELEVRKDTLEQTRQRAKALQADISLLADEREKLNRQLVETARLIQKSEGQMTAIEARLGELEAQDRIVRGSLAQRHDQIARLLAAMQRMGRNPPPVIITKREDALQMVRSAMLLARAFPELRQQAEELAGRLGELLRLMTETRTEGQRLRQETDRLNEARIRLASLMETKKQSVAERQKELEDVRRAASEISQGVSDLSQLISKLDKVVAERTGLGRYEAESQAAPAATEQAATPQNPTQQAATPQVAVVQTVPVQSVPQAASGGQQQTATDQPAAPAKAQSGNTRLAAALPPKPMVELAPVAGFGGNAGRIKPAIPFHEAKAQLPLPAQGRRVLEFGERTQYGGQSKGVVIETRHAAQITSPCDGWVVYAGPFRSYGQLLIINAGNGYHILLAGMSQIDVQLGQFILASEPIGTMGVAQKAATQDSAPVLYVEFRKDGRPIDPDPWWAIGAKADGVRKVQG